MTDETGGLAHLQNGEEGHHEQSHLGNALDQHHHVVDAAVLPTNFASLKIRAIYLKPAEIFYFKEAAIGEHRHLSPSS